MYTPFLPPSAPAAVAFTGVSVVLEVVVAALLLLGGLLLMRMGARRKRDRVDH